MLLSDYDAAWAANEFIDYFGKFESIEEAYVHEATCCDICIDGCMPLAYYAEQDTGTDGSDYDPLPEWAVIHGLINKTYLNGKMVAVTGPLRPSQDYGPNSCNSS